MVLENLKSSAALFNLSSTARNNYISLEHTKIESANKNIENQKFFSTKKKHTLTKRRNAKLNSKETSNKRYTCWNTFVFFPSVIRCKIRRIQEEYYSLYVLHTDFFY